MEIFVCKFNMLKKCKIKTKKNKKEIRRSKEKNQKKQAKKQNTQKCILLFLILTQMIPASYASRVPDAGGGFPPVDNNYKGGSLRER